MFFCEMSSTPCHLLERATATLAMNGFKVELPSPQPSFEWCNALLAKQSLTTGLFDVDFASCFGFARKPCHVQHAHWEPHVSLKLRRMFWKQSFITNLPKRSIAIEPLHAVSPKSLTDSLFRRFCLGFTLLWFLGLCLLRLSCFSLVRW